MTDDDDIDGLAAEYVLGSLDADARKDVARRRKSDAALDQAIKAWETRLGPLSDRISGVEPPMHVFQKITDRLSALERQSLKPTRASFLRRWPFAVGAGALVASLVLVVVWLRDLPGIRTPLIAQLQRSAIGTLLEDGANIWTPFGFVVSFDLRASTIVVSPIAAAASSTRHYQLWLMTRDRGPPISLGVISLPEATTSPWLATYPPDDLVNTTLAVSLEPQGGSPTGVPSGPLMFVGKLLLATQ